jgi:hypothetical protein
MVQPLPPSIWIMLATLRAKLFVRPGCWWLELWYATRPRVTVRPYAGGFSPRTPRVQTSCFETPGSRSCSRVPYHFDCGDYGPIRGISSVTIAFEEQPIHVLDLEGAFRAINLCVEDVVRKPRIYIEGVPADSDIIDQPLVSIVSRPRTAESAVRRQPSKE